MRMSEDGRGERIMSLRGCRHGDGCIFVVEGGGEVVKPAGRREY